MRPPAFWQAERPGLAATVLLPLAGMVAGITARRVARPGWRAPVPVICCGNATVGGAGKTTLVLDLAGRLAGSGVRVHVLTRGHGGSARSTLLVDPAVHDSSLVGDEALLLAEAGPTWLGADRAASAREAVAAGAAVLLMDDGLQNPGLAKTRSLLVIDGASGFGNGRVIPAGPLREPVAACAARCQISVLVGEDAAGSLGRLPASLPVLRARLVPGAEIAGLAGRPVLAFAGIAHPRKFFAMLAAHGVRLAETRAFADHHRFSDRELHDMRARAEALGAVPVTTPKDWVRMAPAWRAGFTKIGVSLAWDDESAVGLLLRTVMG